MTSILTVFPAITISAATMPATNGSGVSFESGFENVYTTSSKLATVPNTYEATITLPSYYSDNYWGTIMSTAEKYPSYSSDQTNLTDIPKSFIQIDAAGSVDGTNKVVKSLDLRFYIGYTTESSGYKEVLASFSNALLPYLGKTFHMAVW
jgi:hypothetical protein